ncbi:GntR family transcriptional regulator [Pseudoalteromonas maricaloris]|uniref:CvfB family protein n=1 Tax=Pseudoalteromonas maricaloris TaxID=184924 RepID=UPI0021AD9C09|nr:S1-like domain-containing RNA-binding protein [Pseudoalteromonas flavipulchra]USE69213.1 GntR family transcriptional regulator [Pseudoalteromonas flavipulchra]
MLGQIKMLTIEELTAEGAYLNGGELGDVFLPRTEVPKHTEEGDSVEVFIYLDNLGHATATTKKPLAQVGEFALLRVKEINKVGAFMDLGIDKDVLAPYNEQKPKMRDGYSYLVRLYLDNASKRICASSALGKFLGKSKAEYEKFEEVDLIVAAKTDLGYKVIVNEKHFGLVFFNDVFKRMYIGQRMKGFVKAVHDEDKIDIVLEKPGIGKVKDLAEIIYSKLEESGGYLPLGDKSDPDAIKRTFSTSKANFKKAIGGLFKDGRIDIEATSISIRKS